MEGLKRRKPYRNFGVGPTEQEHVRQLADENRNASSGYSHRTMVSLRSFFFFTAPKMSREFKKCLFKKRFKMPGIRVTLVSIIHLKTSRYKNKTASDTF